MYHNGDTNALVVLLSMPRVEKLDICVHSSEKILLCRCKKREISSDYNLHYVVKLCSSNEYIVRLCDHLKQTSKGVFKTSLIFCSPTGRDKLDLSQEIFVKPDPSMWISVRRSCVKWFICQQSVKTVVQVWEWILRKDKSGKCFFFFLFPSE